MTDKQKRTKLKKEYPLMKATKLRHRIQQRFRGKTLPPPEEVIAKMREERTQALLDSLKD